MRRAGLDYHEYARVVVHRDFAACRAALGVDRRWYAFTTRSSLSAFDARYAPDDVLVFGCETSGLPDDIVAQFAPDQQLRIPMQPGLRSINLSNAVAIAVYEAWRQNGFAGAG